MVSLPELPHEVVSYITSFVPVIIDKYTRVDCSEPITKIRTERAKQLHHTITDFFNDGDGEIDAFFLHEAAVLNTFDTIEAIANNLLIDNAGWSSTSAVDLNNLPCITFLKGRRGYPGVQTHYKPGMTITRIFKFRHRSVYCLL